MDYKCKQHIMISLLFFWEFKSTSHNIISQLQGQCNNQKEFQEAFIFPPPFFCFCLKNLSENLADTAGNYTKRKYSISLLRKHFSISHGKFCITVHVVPIVDCMTL